MSSRSVLRWGAQNWTQHSRCTSSGLTRGAGSAPWCTGDALPKAPQAPLASLAPRTHCWLMESLVSTRTTRAFSTLLLSSRSPQPVLGCGIILQEYGGACICLSWISEGCSLSISPNCPGPSEGLHSTLEYWPLLPDLSHQWTKTPDIHALVAESHPKRSNRKGKLHLGIWTWEMAPGHLS